MLVRVGVKGNPRELVVETNDSAQQVADSVAAAIADGGVLTLTDEKGGQILVPAAHLAFVELGESERGKVGFTASV